MRKNKGPLVRLPDVVHMLAVAPTSAGKDQGLILPHAFSSRDSQAFVDSKDGEMAELSARHREENLGNEVRVLDPCGILKRKGFKSDTWNIFDSIPRDHPSLIKWSQLIADACVVTTGKEQDPHFPNRSRTNITGGCAYVAQFAPDGDRSLQTVRDILVDNTLLQGAIADMQASDACDGLLARLGHDMAQAPEKERGSILSTTSRMLGFLDDPDLQANMATSSCNFENLRMGERPMSVYFVLPVAFPDAQRGPLLRLWLSSMMHIMASQGRGGGRLVHLLANEMSAMGHLRVMEQALDRYRTFGLRIQMYFQNMQQLQVCFPESHQTVLGNCTQVFFGINDMATAEYLNGRLGQQTITVDSWGTSLSVSNTYHAMWSQQQNNDTRSISRGTSGNTTQMGRDLLRKDEAARMARRLAVTIHPGLAQPILTRLVMHYEEPHLSSRATRLGFSFSPPPFLRALAFMLCGLACAWAVTVIALARERYQPEVTYGQRPFVGWEGGGGSAAGGGGSEGPRRGPRHPGNGAAPDRPRHPPGRR